MRHPLKAEIIEQISPLIDRISHCLVGQNVGLGAYALANLLVTCWRKIPRLNRAGLHEVIDEVWAAAEAVAAEETASKN